MSGSTPTEPRLPRDFAPSRTNLHGQAGTYNVGESDTLFEIAAGQTEVLEAMAQRYPDMSYAERVARLGVVIAADNGFTQLNSRIYLPENRGNPKTLQLRATDDLLRGVEATTDMPQGLSLPQIYEREIPLYPGQIAAIKIAMDTPAAPDAEASLAVMREAAQYYSSVAQYTAMVNTLPPEQRERAMGYLSVTRPENIPATDPHIPTPILDRARTTYTQRTEFTGALTAPALTPPITPTQADNISYRLRDSAVADVGDSRTIPATITPATIREKTVSAINGEPGLENRGTAISAAAPDNAPIQAALAEATAGATAYNASLTPAPAPQVQQSVRIRFEQGGEISYQQLMQAGETGRLRFGGNTVQLPDSARDKIRTFYDNAEAALKAAGIAEPSREQVMEFAAFALATENPQDGLGRQGRNQDHTIQFSTAEELNRLATITKPALDRDSKGGTRITRDELEMNVTLDDVQTPLLRAAQQTLLAPGQGAVVTRAEVTR